MLTVDAVGTDNERSESNSIGKKLELIAPGEQIISTGVFDGLMVSGGTSMAAPHVVGMQQFYGRKIKVVL